MYCGEDTVCKHEDGGRVAISVRCRAWTCDECSSLRQKQLVAELMGGAPTTFLTLTSRRSNARTADQAALDLSKSWRLLRLRIMRKYKLRKLPFMAVMEATEAGWPHLHILLRSIWLDAKWISETMDELDGSPIVKIRRIEDRGRAAGYCAKYAGKAAHKFGTAKRYWQSQDYDLRPPVQQKDTHVPGFGWERQGNTLTQWCRIMHQLGFCVTRSSRWLARAHKEQSARPKEPAQFTPPPRGGFAPDQRAVL